MTTGAALPVSGGLPPIREIDRAKLEGYLLHPVKGHGKAQFFHRFGFARSDWPALRAALLAQAESGVLVETAASPWGLRYTVRGSIATPSRRRPLPTRCTVWQAGLGENSVRLITAYPD